MTWARRILLVVPAGAATGRHKVHCERVAAIAGSPIGSSPSLLAVATRAARDAHGLFNDQLALHFLVRQTTDV